MQISIRRATKNDTELISNLGKATFYNTFNGTCTKADMQMVLDLFFNEAQILKELSDEKDFCFIALFKQKPIGYYRMKANKKFPFDELKKFKAIELKRFYFLKEAQGTGASKVLMQHAIDLAKDLGYNKMYLSVWEYNIRAQEFYKKMGFSNSGNKNDFPLGSTPQTDFWFWKDL